MDAFAGEERGGGVVVVCAVQKKGKKIDIKLQTSTSYSTKVSMTIKHDSFHHKLANCKLKSY